VSLTVDTNLLVCASDTGSALHGRARELPADLAKGTDLVYLFWPVTTEYLRITTHPAVFVNPLAPAAARENIGSLIDRPHVRMPGEGRRFWGVYRDVTDRIPVRGNLVSDAHLVTLMREHGVRTIWTRDRDFRTFDGIEAVDPFE